MTFEDFDKYQQRLIDQVIKMKDTKGKEYANSQDRFANFKRLSEQLGISPLQVAWIYTAKHLDAIAQFCRTEQTYSTEPIEGRLVDAITYLTLIAGMAQEKTQKLVRPDENFTVRCLNCLGEWEVTKDFNSLAPCPHCGKTAMKSIVGSGKIL